MNVYESAKTISALEAAEHYTNAEIIRRGNTAWCACPFHNERTPSCKFSDKGTFYCFGCHAGGTSIDFTMKLFDLTALEAARKICDDFNLTADAPASKSPVQKKPTKKEIDAAFSILDTTTVRYIRWIDDRLSELTPDDDDTLADILLREREKAQRLSEALLEASQARDGDQIERLIIANAGWISEKKADLDEWEHLKEGVSA